MESSDEAETQTQVCLMLEPMFLFMELKWSPSKHYYWHKWTLLRNYSFKTLVTFSSPLIYTDRSFQTLYCCAYQATNSSPDCETRHTGFKRHLCRLQLTVWPLASCLTFLNFNFLIFCRGMVPPYGIIVRASMTVQRKVQGRQSAIVFLFFLPRPIPRYLMSAIRRRRTCLELDRASWVVLLWRDEACGQTRGEVL